MPASRETTNDYTRLIKVNQLQCSIIKDALRSYRLAVIYDMFDTDSGERVLRLVAHLQAIEQLWANLYVPSDMRDLAHDEYYVMKQETQRIVRDRIELFGEDLQNPSE